MTKSHFATAVGLNWNYKTSQCFYQMEIILIMPLSYFGPFCLHLFMEIYKTILNILTIHFWVLWKQITAPPFTAFGIHDKQKLMKKGQIEAPISRFTDESQHLYQKNHFSVQESFISTKRRTKNYPTFKSMSFFNKSIFKMEYEGSQWGCYCERMVTIWYWKLHFL